MFSWFLFYLFFGKCTSIFQGGPISYLHRWSSKKSPRAIQESEPKIFLAVGRRAVLITNLPYLIYLRNCLLSGVRAGNDTLGKELLPYLTTRTGTVAAWAAFHDRDRGAAASKGAQAWDIRFQGFYTTQTCMGGDLKRRQKKSKLWWFRLENRRFAISSAVAGIAKNL